MIRRQANKGDNRGYAIFWGLGVEENRAGNTLCQRESTRKEKGPRREVVRERP